MTDTDLSNPLQPSRNRHLRRVLWSVAAVLAWLGTGAAGDDATSGNRLQDSHDPYLLLHAHNPVDWYPWGPEALNRSWANPAPGAFWRFTR